MLIKLVVLLKENGNEPIDLYYQDIAQLIGSSTKTIQRAKAQLVNHGYIDVKQNHKRSGRIAGTFTVNLHQIKVDIDDRVQFMPLVNGA